MKAHRTDGVSLVFALIFLALAGWWLLAQILDLALPAVGWFLAGALILIGVLGLFGALRSARSNPAEVTPQEAVPQEATPPATELTEIDEPTVYPTRADQPGFDQPRFNQPVGAAGTAGDADPGAGADDAEPTVRLSTDRE